MRLQHDSVWCRPRPSAGRPVRRGHRWRYPRPSITPLVAAAFATVGALSPRTDDPATASRPLDTARDGFDVAEGASVLVIERRSTLGHAVPGPTARAAGVRTCGVPGVHRCAVLAAGGGLFVEVSCT
ncbi:beta-ketoacyl synthase N-terminal-like domain-containing protein [Streptomyces flaveolus]|uniref:beta-ketoacyl synthase N-terminal-like domain-containing protein n=1 Tax=Streptomyces flaveolus TaxID=67297 RepID=UPI00370137EA